jgi:hypothetical protein
MKLTRKERELLMNEKYYIHLEEIKPSQFVYGVMGVVEDTPFDYEISKMVGKRDEIINEISKKIIRENKLGVDRNVFNLRYSELSDAKTMQYNLKYDDFYRRQRVNISPAVFLSDMDKVNILTKMVQKNALQEQIIANSKYGLIK